MNQTISATRITEARAILATRLRHIRINAVGPNGTRMTGQVLAAKAGWGASGKTKVSKIENGTQAPTPGDIRKWCAVCQAEEQVPDLLASQQALEAMYNEWKRLEQDGLREVQASFAPLYDATSLFRIWQHSWVPGLLQTPAYALGHMRRIMEFRGIPDDLDQAVDQRLALQGVLSVPAKRFVFVIGEQALRTPVVSGPDLVEQLNRLNQTIGERQNVSLGIVPCRAVPTVMPPENFWVYDHDQVRVDGVAAQFRIRKPDDVEAYESAFTKLAEIAVYGQAAKDLIRTAIAEVE